MVGTLTRAAAISRPGTFFVAVGDHDQTVKLVSQGHGLGGVGDEVPGDQGVFHAYVAHGDAVAHGDGGELDGRAAGGPDAGLDGVGDLIQVHVAGDDLVIGADHADQRPLQLLPGKTQGIEQRAVGSGGNSGFDDVACHKRTSLSG